MVHMINFLKQLQKLYKAWNMILSTRALTVLMISNNELTRNDVVKNYVVMPDVTKSCYGWKFNSLIQICLQVSKLNVVKPSSRDV